MVVKNEHTELLNYMKAVLRKKYVPPSTSVADLAQDAFVRYLETMQRGNTGNPKHVARICAVAALRSHTQKTCPENETDIGRTLVDTVSTRSTADDDSVYEYLVKHFTKDQAGMIFNVLYDGVAIASAIRGTNLSRSVATRMVRRAKSMIKQHF